MGSSIEIKRGREEEKEEEERAEDSRCL